MVEHIKGPLCNNKQMLTVTQSNTDSYHSSPVTAQVSSTLHTASFIDYADFTNEEFCNYVDVIHQIQVSIVMIS